MLLRPLAGELDVLAANCLGVDGDEAVGPAEQLNVCAELAENPGNDIAADFVGVLSGVAYHGLVIRPGYVGINVKF